MMRSKYFKVNTFWIHFFFKWNSLVDIQVQYIWSPPGGNYYVCLPERSKSIIRLFAGVG